VSIFAEAVLGEFGEITTPQFGYGQLVALSLPGVEGWAFGRIDGLVVAHDEKILDPHRVETPNRHTEWLYAVRVPEHHGGIVIRSGHDIALLCNVQMTAADYASHERKLAREDGVYGRQAVEQ
jgi:hypothetical protein